jgi:hypothetical protein
MKILLLIGKKKKRKLNYKEITGKKIRTIYTREKKKKQNEGKI